MANSFDKRRKVKDKKKQKKQNKTKQTKQTFSEGKDLISQRH